MADGHAQAELGLFDESTQRRSGTTDMTPEADVLLNGSGSGYHAQLDGGVNFGLNCATPDAEF